VLAAFLLFCRSPPARKRRREEAKPDPPSPVISCGGRAWRRRAALFLQLQNAFLAIPGLFWVYL